jgi:8-oxoguanine deaminase
VASPAYLARQGTPTQPRDLARHNCIGIRQGDEAYGIWRLAIGRADGKAGQSIKTRGNLATNDGEIAVNWALDGHGILMRSEWDVVRYLRSGRLVEVLPGWRTPPPTSMRCTRCATRRRPGCAPSPISSPTPSPRSTVRVRRIEPPALPYAGRTMPTLLIRHATCVATLDDARTEWRDASILVRDGFIEAVGPANDLAQTADEVIDARGHLVVPGLVNTHHHMFQSLTRALPGVQDAELFGWLRGLYPVWAGLTPEMIHVSTQVAMAELLLSGCTTSSDHLYIYPNGVRLDDCIEAARAIGMRFVATRGSMSVGHSAGGLPPDRVVEREDAILRDTQRLIEAYHDARPGAMVQVGVAPCSPFSVSRDLMRESAALARSFAGQNVRLHTHLAENDHDIAYSREKFNRTPAEYAQDLGWLGSDVWHAHCVKLDEEGISLFAATRTGVAHCPCSNMRLASGIAPVRRMLDAGVPVGLGVDGSASNDAAQMVNEARQAMLLARLRKSLDAPGTDAQGRTVFGCDTAPMEMTARDALALATRGGAQVLGRRDIGQIAPGLCADLALFDLRTVAMAGGAVHDPVASLLLCASPQAAYTVVHGRVVVREGQLTTVDLPPLLERHNRLARELAGQSR